MAGLSDGLWRTAISVARNGVGPSTTAKTFLKRLDGFSESAAVACTDGNVWVLKSLLRHRSQMPWALTAEQVVGRLGAILSTPTPTVAYVELPAALVSIEPQLAHLAPGLVHGSLRILARCKPKEGVLSPGSQQNREAFGRLGVLYGWMAAGDHQLIRTDPGDDVFSVDHGHFFSGGPGWSATTLAIPGTAVPDVAFADCDPDVRNQTLERARAVTDKQLAAIVGASSPSWWGVPVDDLIALGKYLSARRDTL